jgi:hypothetical protein
MDDGPDRCTATAKSTGERCKQPAIPGGDVCRFHGGSAEQVQDKAQERLDRMADETTAEMQDILDDLTTEFHHAPPEEKVSIARELRQAWVKILDRTGHGPTEKRELEHSGEGENGGIIIDMNGDDE